MSTTTPGSRSPPGRPPASRPAGGRRTPLPASELLVLGHKQRPYRLPRQPGAGRVVAPALPFSDTAAVRFAAANAMRACAGQPQLVTVSCDRSELAELAIQIAQTGVGGLR